MATAGQDVISAQSEASNDFQPPPGGVIWWEAPVDRRNGTWIPHTIDGSIQAVHRMRLADINGDGRPDIVFAEQEQSAQDRVGILFRVDAAGNNWQEDVISNGSGHNIDVGDVNGDGKLDILNAPHGYYTGVNPIELYLNLRNGSPAIPAAPGGLTATAGNKQVTLTWNTSSGASGYNVYRGTSPGAESATPVNGNTPLGSPGFTDANLTNGQAYYYTVTAVNSTGESSPSTEKSATPTLAIPAAPAGLSAAAGNTQVVLSWSAVSGATGYNIYRGTSANGESGTPVNGNTPVSGTSFTNIGLTNGQAYFYKVTAVNAAGESLRSNEAFATPANNVYVSDLAYTAVANGWGPVEKDKSNGDINAGDGRPISLHGVTYAKGLGVHASSEVDVNLGGAYATFQADVGLDDETNGLGSVIFQVYADGTKIYDSGLVTGSTPTAHVSVGVSGKSLLRLVVTDGGDNKNSDHADWAGARLT